MDAIFKSDSAPANTRIILKAYAFNHTGEITSHGRRLQVSLIDITPTGARLKLLDASQRPPLPEERFTCNIMLDDLGVESGELPCRTVWCEGSEFGIAFIKELQTTVSELQRSIDQQARAS